MKKTSLLFRLVVGLAVVIFMSSCSGGSQSDYRNYLPGDYFMTISANAEQISKKADMPEEHKQLMLDFAQKMSGGKMSDQESEMLSFMSDPSSLGIDISEDIFIFMSISDKGTIDNPMFDGGFLFKMKNKDDFERFISKTAMGAEFEKRNDSGFEILLVKEAYNQTMILAYNDIAAMILFTTGEYDTAQGYLNRLAKQGKKSLLGNKQIAEVLNGSDDINVLMSFKSLPLEWKMQFAAVPMGNIINELEYVLSSNFEKGRIRTTANLIVKDKNTEKKIREYYSYAIPLTGGLTKFIPEDPTISIAAGIKGAELYNMLVGMGGQFAMLGMVPQAKDFLGTIDGDMVILASDLDANNNNMPFKEVSFLLTVNDAEILDKLIEDFGAFAVISPLANNAYQLNVQGIPLIAGMSGNVLYISTSNRIYNIAQGSAAPVTTKYASLYKGITSLISVNITEICDLARQNISPYDYNAHMALSIFEVFEDTVIYSDDNYVGIWDVNMTDKEANAFKTIHNNIFNMFSSFVKELF